MVIVMNRDEGEYNLKVMYEALIAMALFTYSSY